MMTRRIGKAPSRSTRAIHWESQRMATMPTALMRPMTTTRPTAMTTTECENERMRSRKRKPVRPPQRQSERAPRRATARRNVKQ